MRTYDPHALDAFHIRIFYPMPFLFGTRILWPDYVSRVPPSVARTTSELRDIPFIAVASPLTEGQCTNSCSRCVGLIWFRDAFALAASTVHMCWH